MSRGISEIKGHWPFVPGDLGYRSATILKCDIPNTIRAQLRSPVLVLLLGSIRDTVMTEPVIRPWRDISASTVYRLLAHTNTSMQFIVWRQPKRLNANLPKRLTLRRRQWLQCGTVRILELKDRRVVNGQALPG